MFCNIKEDIKIFYPEKNRLNYIKVFLEHSFHLVLLIRFGFFCDKKIPILGKILRFLVEYIIRVVFASDISCKAKIGKGFRVVHGHDIVIGSDVVIGDYCKIFNGVTLGNKYTENNLANQPTVGDYVIISTGAKILGNVVIGSHSVIGANSVVIKSVPPNSVVVGVPGRVIVKDEYNE
jgi:serine O-acetyltransferase